MNKSCGLLNFRASWFSYSWRSRLIIIRLRLVLVIKLKENLEFDTSFNIWEFYRGVLTGEQVDLSSRSCINRIDRTKVTYESWEDWYREVIWYGNKKGAYLYGNEALDREIAGHY